MMKKLIALFLAALLALSAALAEELNVAPEPEQGEPLIEAEATLAEGPLAEPAPQATEGEVWANATTGEADGFSYALLEDGTASVTDCSLEGDVVIPEALDGHTVTNLKAELFYGRSDITSVTIPATVTYFGNNPGDSTFTYVFSYCYALTTIRVKSGNPSFTSVDGVLYSKDRKILYNYPCSHPGDTYRVPEKTELLDCTSFACAWNLTSLYLDSPETAWRTYTFYGDGGLTVYYLTGGYSETMAKTFIGRGMYADEDDSYPTYRGIKGASPTPTPTAAPGTKVTGVTIKQGKSATLYMGNKLTLKATVQPAGAKATLTWSSNKTSVATVSNKGVVTPKKKGTAKITVKEAGGKKATITVKVVDVKSVKIAEGKKAALKKGKKLTLHATVSPEQVKTKLTWKSSDTKVATVSSKGVVKAKKAGTAKITATAANGKKATITITVSK